ncbi:MAG: bifunctional DNA-formamidopyrimidine glycosylase/DNA-(apurinic or apyrimidinic site) lyase [Patescibacteria group bacterium]
MPELPEVETLRCDLSRRIIGEVIESVSVGNRKMVSPAKSFSRLLKGQRITAVNRRGKLLILDVASGLRLHVHLKMTGQLVYRRGRVLVVGGHAILGATAVPNSYTQLLFRFRNKGELYFNDQRQFGYAKILTLAASDEVVQRFGPEPLAKNFTRARLTSQLARRSRTSLKAALLDQSVLAGVGNIYADEICFRAGLRPERQVQSLTQNDQQRLWRSIRAILQRSVRLRGTMRSTYRRDDARDGRYWPYIAVYGRGGKPCRNCGTPLERFRVAGRGTVCCPICQR